MGHGQFDAAVEDMDRALAIAPQDPTLLLNRCVVHRESGRLDEAIADASRMIQLYPDDSRPYRNRAVCYYRRQQYDRAIADMTQCIRLQPEGAEAYYGRAYFRMQNREYAEALEDFSRAMELQPPTAADLHSRAKLLIRLGRYEEAITDLTRLTELAPAETSSVMVRGMAYELVGANRLALADYDLACERPGPIGKYGRLWKYILLRLDDQTQAASECLAVQNSGEGGRGWTDRLLELFAGEMESAELLTAAATDDERAEAYYYIGMYALLNDEEDAAVEALQKCVALNRPAILETDFARARLKQLEEAAAPAEQDSRRLPLATDPSPRAARNPASD